MIPKELHASLCYRRIRQFLVGSVCAISMVTGLSSCGASGGEDEKAPNFLIVIADDAGWNDVGYHGSRIQTPNIDRLASQGTQLNRFYVAPTCSPTRASLLTGMPASRMGIVAPISGRSEKTLPDSIPTLPSVLGQHGYQTGLSGKWHLGLRSESGPTAYGFDYSYGFLHGQIDQYSHEYKNGDISWHENGEFFDEEGHATDLITRNALQQLEKYAETGDPFYLQVAYTAPHIPLQEEPQWTNRYDTVFQDSSRVLYAAAMTHMDHSIGKLMEALEKLEISKSTVVLFMSDNGAQENWYPGDHLYEGRFEPNPVLGSNEPLRGWKTSVYEGGIRVPAVIRIPGETGGKINDNFLAVYDLFPTLLQMAGISPDDYPSLEGVGMKDALLGSEDLPQREIYIRGHLGACVIDEAGKKLIWFEDSANNPMEVYDVINDPEEKINLSDDEVLLEALSQILQKNIAKDNL